MMLNPMAAGLPEAQWTQYDPGSDFEDCEYRVEEMEFLGVKSRYIMIRGTIINYVSPSLHMPAGITVSFPLRDYPGSVIQCRRKSGNLEFWQASIYVNDAGDAIDFNTFGSGAKFLVFARVS